MDDGSSACSTAVTKAPSDAPVPFVSYLLSCDEPSRPSSFESDPIRPIRPIAVDENYLDLVYGPIIGATAVLVVRYLHASLPLRASPICTLEELSAATGSRPKRLLGALNRAARYRLLTIDHGDGGEHDRRTIVLAAEIPAAPASIIDRLPPMATQVARRRLEQ